MRQIHHVTALLMLLACVCLAAEPEPTIDQLVAQLGHRSFATREKASKLLRERGPAALPALRTAVQGKDEEVRRRAEALIPPLEIEEAMLPKRVTLKAENRSLDDVLKELEKQTGYKLVRTGGANDQRVTIDVRDEPFWSAMEPVLKATTRIAYFDSNQKSVWLNVTNRRSPFVDFRGPFRLEAQWFHEDRDVDFTATPGKDGKRDHRLTLSVSVLAEPRITFLKVSPAKVDEALDSDGRSLLEPTGPGNAYIGTVSGRGMFRGESLMWSDVRLRRASATAKTAKIIRGTIPVKMVLIRRSVVVTSKLLESTGTSFRAGADSLQISRVQNQGGNNVEVQIQVPYDRQGNNHDQWYQRFHVEDDAGHKFQDHGRGSQSDGRNYWISLYYGPPNGKAVGPPTKLIFEDWVVHEYAIPFEFKNVPLP